MIMRPEIAFAKTADGAVAAVEEPFVDRDFRRGSLVLEAVDDPGPRAEGKQRAVVWTALLGFVSEQRPLIP